MAFPFYKQYDYMDCGPTCLQMIAKYYGKSYKLQSLREISNLGREGVSLLNISKAAEKLGFRTTGARIEYDSLVKEATLPCIVHWRQNHFVIVYKVTNKIKDKFFLPSKKRSGELLYVADPERGLLTYTKDEFLVEWLNNSYNERKEGIILLLEPTPVFFDNVDEPQPIGSALIFDHILKYLLAYKRLLFQLFLGILSGSILQLIFPFLTQSIIDVGLNTQNLNFIYLVLAAQLTLLTGRTVVDFVRSWILLHISSRVNISLLSDFLAKLMRLSLSYFDVKMFGDTIQRIGDHQRVESFLTGTALTTLFSFINLILFSFALAYYNWLIFVVFCVGSLLYGFWITIFFKQRRNLDTRRFDIGSQNQSLLIQMIAGMQEIKLANAELQKRWEWERVQAKTFYLNVKSLTLSQYQSMGGFLINECKNIIITFLSAKLVLDGQLTLGGMLAIQYMTGMLNSPVYLLIQFFQNLQDAKISLERMNEIHTLPDEEPISANLINFLPQGRTVTLKDICFTYEGTDRLVLQNINLTIEEGKKTAIVGMSGSGKTTLLKLLLKFYNPEKGSIHVSNTNLKRLSPSLWRSKCGVVMQDGYIFSDTIARNIAVGEENIDFERLLEAIQKANLQEFVESLAMSYNTKIGTEGVGLSQGQRQRVLIARAIYKDPDFIFFDEATNALDATNEKIITQNLEGFFSGKTVIVVAHRLSTVKNADKIVVLNQGFLVEEGTHNELIKAKGKYYELIKNQLELDD
ncbi:peptidase domain-containing ABC transporter [Xanthocytophaga agilis]|uniref:Peptidase domain-containing ABC transporter n=1 Tax=Xanthocytophaga agilis TaxID=3048010 RepID=A0AAE3UGH4_9BACT|nr:peptidase domain-containing ABC transporter [Xanthocytophaga agilis]MDJ1503296.1 peptidase domain-containing ABC transporter [Xanthocytophaga agilis]